VAKKGILERGKIKDEVLQLVHASPTKLRSTRRLPFPKRAAGANPASLAARLALHRNWFAFSVGCSLIWRGFVPGSA